MDENIETETAYPSFGQENKKNQKAYMQPECNGAIAINEFIKKRIKP